jgi:2-keto-4-pentenoate hydratase/2-oxohepta-3-ene-1,7-dioic acid hydratase in catechol pathway
VGEPVPSEGVELAALEIQALVNGEPRQHGRASEMAFSIPFLLAYISHVMTLERGDLILTGTPAGVGPLVSGDRVRVEIVGVGHIENPVVAAPAP